MDNKIFSWKILFKCLFMFKSKARLYNDNMLVNEQALYRKSLVINAEQTLGGYYYWDIN